MPRERGMVWTTRHSSDYLQGASQPVQLWMSQASRFENKFLKNPQNKSFLATFAHGSQIPGLHKLVLLIGAQAGTLHTGAGQVLQGVLQTGAQ